MLRRCSKSYKQVSRQRGAESSTPGGACSTACRAPPVGPSGHGRAAVTGEVGKLEFPAVLALEEVVVAEKEVDSRTEVL